MVSGPWPALFHFIYCCAPAGYSGPERDVSCLFLVAHKVLVHMPLWGYIFFVEGVIDPSFCLDLFKQVDKYILVSVH